MLLSRIVVFTFSCWLADAALLAQPVQYLLTSDYSASVNDVWATAAGDSVWAATSNGVVLFTRNGTRQTIHVPSFHASRVVRHNNVIWVAGKDSIGQYVNGEWSFLSQRQGMPSDGVRINDMVVHHNELWFLVNQRLYRVHRNRAIVRVLREGNLLASDGTTLFLGLSRSGLTQPIFTMKDNEWDTLPPQGQYSYRPAGMDVGNNGALIVSRNNGSVARFSQGTWHNGLPFNTGVPLGGGAIGLNDSIIYMQAPAFMNIVRITPSSIDTLHIEYSERNPRTAGLSNNAVNFKVFGSRLYKLLRRRVVVYYPELALQKNGFDVLDVNNIRLPVLSNGRVGGGLTTKERVSHSGVDVITELSPWLRLDFRGEQRLRSTLHKEAENDLYFSGPNARHYDSAYVHRYNEVWKISRETIDYHKAHYQDTNYVIPRAIARWPVAGRVNNGEPEELAPYIDVNKNGVYDPENGDYPAVPGHQAVYTIFTPRRGQAFSMHDYDNLRLEIHLLAYAYDSAEAPELNDAVFLHYRVFNRSNSDYGDVLFSLMTHFADEQYHLTGSDSARQAWFGYPRFTNASSMPAVAIGAFNTEMKGYMYFYRYLRTGDFNFRPPVTTEEHLRVLNARTALGRRVRFDNPDGPGSIHNGTGFGAGFNLPQTNWLLNATANWYHPPLYGDPVVGLPYFNLGTIPVKSSACLSLVLCAGQAAANGHNLITASVDAALHNLDAVRQMSALFPYDCGGRFISNRQFEARELHVYPNPMQSGGHFRIQTDEYVQYVALSTATGQTQSLNALPYERGWELALPENLSPGVYVLRIHLPYGVIHRKILVADKR